MSVMRPELIMKSIIPVVMAGIIAIYGLVVAILIAGTLEEPSKNYSLYQWVWFSSFVFYRLKLCNLEIVNVFCIFQRIPLFRIWFGSRVFWTRGRFCHRNSWWRGRARHSSTASSFRGNDFNSHFCGSTRFIRAHRSYLPLHETIN